MSRPVLSSKKSINLTQNIHLAGDTTTALTVDNVESDEIEPLMSGATAGEPQDTEDDVEDLQSILHSYIRRERSPHRDASEVPLAKMNIAKCEPAPNPDFIEAHVARSRLDTEAEFHRKFKHVFVLSSAGKPVYALNGSDRVTAGFMGLITALVASVEGNMHLGLRRIRYGDLQIVVCSHEPLVLVAVSKLHHESHQLLSRQLEYIHSYLLAVLSKLTITRSYHNRSNYDLRKVLTALDFQNLDGICMQMSYGHPARGGTTHRCSMEFFVSHLLDFSLPSFRITHTVRKKVSAILQKCRKRPEADSRTLLSLPKHEDVVEDLLFALLLAPTNKIVGFSRPKSHHLSCRDLSILTYIISSATADTNTASEDLWIPVCMPDFNSTGFLYAFIKRFDLATYVVVDGRSVSPQPLQIVLLSSNKNTFDAMQAIADNVLHEIVWNESLRCALSDDMRTAYEYPLGLEYFVFRLKKHNQLVTSDPATWSLSGPDVGAIQLTKFLSVLCNTKSQSTSDPDSLDKKLTYLKWNFDGWAVTGLRLSDKSYEFYGLCNHLVVSQDLINTSLGIIKWCRSNIRRLTMEEGVY